MPAPGLQGHSLLGVFAHPDDEALACGGLLSWCAELGCEISLLCLTRGEHGPDRGEDDLASTREAELRSAARALGVRHVVVLGHEDGMLPFVDSRSVEGEIRTVIERFRPDVVVTFDEDGLYWHPDHISVHERTTAAVSSIGVEAPALFYVSIPEGRMRAVVDHAATVACATDDPPSRIFGVTDVDAFGTLAPAPTLVLETGAHAVRKLHAILCHRSQLHDSAFALIDEPHAERLLGREQFRRAKVGARGATFMDRLAAVRAGTADRERR